MDEPLVDPGAYEHTTPENTFTNWLTAHGSWLRRRCRARLGNAVDAEDAVQDIMLILLQSIDRFEGRSSLLTWVTRIADNHCCTMIRRRSARAISDHLLENITRYEAERRYVRPTYERDGNVEEVHLTLRRLTDSNREVLELRFFADLSFEQIATTLGVSLSAAKMRLYRALHAFRQKHPVDEIGKR